MLPAVQPQQPMTAQRFRNFELRPHFDILAP
jgi:hypothetical protein